MAVEAATNMKNQARPLASKALIQCIVEYEGLSDMSSSIRESVGTSDVTDEAYARGHGSLKP